MRSLPVRQTSVALERRVRAILAARRSGYRFNERDAALDVVVERIWQDIVASTHAEGDDSDEPGASTEALAATGLRLVGAGV